MTLTLSTKLPASPEIMSMKVNSCTPSTPLLSNAQTQNTSLSLLSLKSTLNSLSRLPPSSKLKMLPPKDKTTSTPTFNKLDNKTSVKMRTALLLNAMTMKTLSATSERMLV
uniref:Uncharacterized protein n=1 Tax=Cacopsylla melanoneura TaxID=428564 RepID=A0A8D8XP01_9HEMI